MASPVESAVAFAGLGRAFTALLVPLLLLTSCPGASAGTTNPVMYTEPYLLSPTQTSMYVCWLTAEPTTQSYVEYGADESYGKTQAAVTYEIHGFLKKDASGSYTVPFPVYQQIAHVTGLEAGQKTFYRAVSELAGGTQKGPGYYFHTAPKPGTPIKFVLLSDMQGKKQIVDTVRFAGQQNADAIIYNGDLWSGPNYEAGESFSYPGAPLPVGADYASELHRWFNCLQQTSDGAKLLQYIPIYPCPGNHEIDEQYRMQKKDQADPNKMNMSLYCQLFRPLYPEQQYGRNGKHWYSRDFGSLHIVSLSIQRSYSWGASEAPGWPLFDDVKAGSPQQKWLADDLRNSTYGHYTWVTQHWHVFNRRDDVATPFTEPVVDPATQAVTYPGPDYLQRDILPLFTQYGVNGVSFGHSHVYERYLVNGVNYIEAASIGNNYHTAADPATSPNGPAPVFEEQRFRTLMAVTVDPAKGMSAQGLQASVEADGVGKVGNVFDQFSLAPQTWKGDPFGLAGDLDNDGEVTLKDTARMLRILVLGGGATEAELKAGDLNGDGKLSLADALIALRAAAGIGR